MGFEPKPVKNMTKQAIHFTVLCILCTLVLGALLGTLIDWFSNSISAHETHIHYLKLQNAKKS